MNKNSVLLSDKRQERCKDCKYVEDYQRRCGIMVIKVKSKWDPRTKVINIEVCPLKK